MKASRGQALLELAICAPVILTLALGTVDVVQVLEGQTGLQAATDAAVGAAARATDAGAAIVAAQTSFKSVIAGYRAQSATFAISVGDFTRGSLVSGDSVATVEAIGVRIVLRAHAAARGEPWRSRP